MCTNTLVASGELLKSFQLPPLIFLFAQLFDNAINFIAAFLIILVPLVFLRSGPKASLALLPFAFLLLLAGVIGMTWILATAQVFFRDTRFIISFVMSLAFFLTPVFYPPSYIPESYRWMIHVNPFYQLIRPFRAILYTADPDAIPGGIPGAFAAATLVSFVFLSIAAVTWMKKKNAVYFYI